MARFDLFVNPEGPGWLLDVQSSLFNDLKTRLVVPLALSSQAPMPVRRLNPTFAISGKEFIMLTELLFALPTSLLRSPHGNLSDHQDEITAALDMIFQGF